MSLNAEERARTGGELRANLRLSGLPPEQVQQELGFTDRQFASALDCDDASQPQDVWLLRDHLEQLVLERGRTPVPYSVLTEAARSAARGWFRLRRPPARRPGS